MLADYHLHTHHSDDSEAPMEAMVDRALALGLDEIAFTEHVDHGVKPDVMMGTPRDNCDYATYAAEMAELQRRYAGRITIRKGIEFGVQSHTIDRFRRDFAENDFDFVILSNHQVGDKEFWNGFYQEGRTQAEIHADYYQALYVVVCCFADYSVLGHLDMIKRYDPHGEYPDEKVLPIVEKILRRVIADGKGIEINTSCRRYGLKDWTPSRPILKLYRDLGGEIVTIGSDAHKPADLGEAVGEAQQLLRELGFTHIYTFEKMRPIAHPL